MNENDLVKTNEKKSLFTIKNVLRVLSLLCIIFVFCPSFLVSCSGQTINVNVMTAVRGLSLYGETAVDPHPIMLICLLIPIAVLVLMFINKLSDNKIALITIICGVVDIIVWFIFRSSVKKTAEENYCEFKTTGWFVFNIIVLFMIVILSALVMLMKIQLDTDLIKLFSGGGTKEAFDQMSSKMSQMSSAMSQLAGNAAAIIGNKTQKEDVIGFCTTCGRPIAYGCKFCISCGTPVPESMLAEAEAARKAVEQEMQSNNDKPKFCQNCGAKLTANAAFCNLCGTKVE